MSKYHLILFFIFNFISAQNKSKNYFVYHDNINKAEKLFFQENKIDSSMFYYDKVFKEFDFIFVKDIVNAIQIAVYTKKPYKKYIEIGFENGLKIKHLQSIPILIPIYKELQKDKKSEILFNEKRKLYLKKIDYKYLDWIYKIAINDQVNKYYPQKKYFPILEKDIIVLRDSILKKGFPSDRILGIQDSTIFRETKNLKYLDITQRVKKIKKAVCYTEIVETEFASAIILPMLLHINCVTKLISKEELLSQVKMGNIHPREIGFFNDFSFMYRDKMPSCCEGYKFEGFYFNSFGYASKPIDSKKANLLREKIHMCSFEVDEIKKEYEKKYGFILFSGMWNYR